MPRSDNLTLGMRGEKGRAKEPEDEERNDIESAEIEREEVNATGVGKGLWERGRMS